MPRKKSAKTEAKQVQVRAVIFLGASAISMMVAETAKGQTRVLDVLSQPINLAQDVFTLGNVTRETMDRCVQIARGFNDLLAEYRLAGEVQVRLLATNILQNIHNLDTLVNRLQIACGLHLEVMDNGEMTRLLYMSLQSTLERRPDLQKKRLLVLHLGPGNTRLFVYDKERITYYANYRMGAHRTGIGIGDVETGGADSETALIREHIRGTVEQVLYDLESALPSNPDALVIYGPDFHLPRSPLAVGDHVTVDGLTKLAHDIARTPMNRRVERYHEDYAGVYALLPAVVTYQTLARAITPDSILCPPEEYEQSFLLNLLPATEEDSALEDEVIHFSQLLADRYRADRGHSRHIRKLCMSLFDQLKELHGLTRHDRLLLKVAAILHEVGTFISPRGHHHHSQYIILNSEIFGLSRLDSEVVGLLARYHRHGAPSEEDRSYMELSLTDRLRVQKLSALLRVAEAMERAHSHRVSEFTVRFNNRRLELLVPGVHDLTLENMALRSKGCLFTDIFGYDITLLPVQAAK